ncbi:MAG TPA: hypothetical protein ENK43_02665, partial [Planctomycetes bacterium]|nr:hypothetical protein [Planctomycetota bacterium]
MRGDGRHRERNPGPPDPYSRGPGDRCRSSLRVRRRRTLGSDGGGQENPGRHGPCRRAREARRRPRGAHHEREPGEGTRTVTRQVLEIPPLELPYDVRLNLPGSKSQANRLLGLAALLPGDRLLANLPCSEDVTLMIEGLRALGYTLHDVPGHPGRLHVKGGPPPSPGEGVIDCRLAGTTSRFLTAIAAITPGRWTLTGS